MKKKLKDFFTLARKADGGFTLVELIVVIAILAILAGVAVPAYNGYVEKANKQSDVSLASEVAHALTLAFYNQKLPEGGYVILSADGATTSDSEENTAVKDALIAVFGADSEGNPNVPGLKWDGWKGVSTASYADTNFYENEDVLLPEVVKLTNVLTEALPGMEWGNGAYGEFLAGYGIEKTDYEAAGNAMVLYVAQEVSDPTKEALITSTMQSIGTKGIDGAFDDLTRGGLSQPAALAVIYSYAEGLALYADEQNRTNTVSTNFHNNTSFENKTISNATDALKVISDAFNSLAVDTGYLNDSGAKDLASEYMDSDTADGGMNDLAGFISIMGTVWDSKDLIEGNLTSEECFTDGSVANLLNGYASMCKMGVSTSDGQIAVGIMVQEDGTFSTTILPLILNNG